MRNGYIVDVLTSVDIQRLFKKWKKGGSSIRRRYSLGELQKSPFRKGLEKLFGLRQKHKKERSHLVRGLVKFLIDSLYGTEIGRDINEFYKCKSQHCMGRESDDHLLDYWKLPNGIYIVQIKKDGGLDQRFSNFYNLSTTYIYGKKTHVSQENFFPAVCKYTNKKLNVKYEFVYLNIFVIYQAVFR